MKNLLNLFALLSLVLFSCSNESEEVKPGSSSNNLRTADEGVVFKTTTDQDEVFDYFYVENGDVKSGASATSATVFTRRVMGDDKFAYEYAENQYMSVNESDEIIISDLDNNAKFLETTEGEVFTLDGENVIGVDPDDNDDPIIFAPEGKPGPRKTTIVESSAETQEEPLEGY